MAFSVEPQEDANALRLFLLRVVLTGCFFFCTPHSQRGALCSWAQLLAHNSSFYVPLFLPVSVAVSPKKGSGCHFASRLCVCCEGGVCCEHIICDQSTGVLKTHQLSCMLAFYSFKGFLDTLVAPVVALLLL